MSRIIRTMQSILSGSYLGRVNPAPAKETSNENQTWVPPGHFYSPIPNPKEIRLRHAAVFSRDEKEIKGVNLNIHVQKNLLNEISQYAGEIPFAPEKKEGLHYYFENEFYGYFDGTILYCMLRHLRPKRYVEIGSGFSSCLVLDTNRLSFDGNMEITFIEPYPAILKSLLTEQDKEVRLIEKKLQEVDLKEFSNLQSGDILFVDSTHVTKTDSDVNRILFEILPSLASGVYIHFHDVFYPFEYPEKWVYEGRAWNEDYMLRAFLQYNTAFEIVMFNSFVSHFFRSTIKKRMSVAFGRGTENQPFLGGGFWLRKK